MRLLAADRARAAGLKPIAGDPRLPLQQRNLDVGGGVHKCIGLYFGGMEITAVLHRMLLEYDWSVPDDYVVPISWKSLPYPADGLPITLTRRS